MQLSVNSVDNGRRDEFGIRAALATAAEVVSHLADGPLIQRLDPRDEFWYARRVDMPS